MSQQDIITHSDISNLLASGAFLRDGRHVHLLQGPFAAEAHDKTQSISVCCPDFYETEKLTFLKPARAWALDTAEFSRSLLRYVEEASEPAPPLHWIEPSRKDFEVAFARVQNLISEGQIDKAVPAVFARATLRLTPALKARWMLELLRAPEGLHPYGFWDGDEGMIGATPEILFQIEGRQLRTMALAGTWARANGSAQDLVRSKKDQHEHRIVVEDVRRELQRFGSPRVGETHVMELPTLFHLRTDFELDLESEPEIETFIRRLHPTAALGVFPRVFGWRWMRELPGQMGRGRFGAPFTMRVSPTRVLSLVSIRGLQWNGEALRLGSGCGVVKDSDLEAEWDELRRKRASVLSLLGLNP